SQVHLVFPALKPAEEAGQATEFSLGHAFADEPHMLRRQLVERCINGNSVVGRQRQQLVELVTIRRSVPWSYCAFANRLAGIGHNQFQIKFGDVAETFARWTSTERAVEAEPARFWV